MIKLTMINFGTDILSADDVQWIFDYKNTMFINIIIIND